jgi:hypothetical protein
MTFEEFVSTRKYCENIGDAIRDECLEGIGGYLYLGCLFIEDITSWSAGDIAHKNGVKLGRWYTYIENCEYDSNSIEDIEKELYMWALRNGYDEEFAKLCENGV